MTFQFDKGVIAWKALVGGVDHNTGFLADSGNSVTASTNITAEIDHTELQQEGENVVNIYGQGADGSWTVKA